MILVAGAGGHIGGHLVAELLRRGDHVRAVDAKPFDRWWQIHEGSENRRRDLREPDIAGNAVRGCCEVYNLAADMGGIEYISSHAAACMTAVTIHAHLLGAASRYKVERYLFASSSCVYPDDGVSTQVAFKEGDAHPAAPFEGYGWEKLFGEKMAMAVGRETGMAVRIGRLFNVYGPHGDWTGGREKVVPALCRKVAQGGPVHVWGDGHQTRSFTAMADAVEGIIRLMASDCTAPLNIGSSRLTSIAELAEMIERLADRDLPIIYRPDQVQGVRGRSSDNTMIRAKLGWEPAIKLEDALPETYEWVVGQVRKQAA